MAGGLCLEVASLGHGVAMVHLEGTRAAFRQLYRLAVLPAVCSSPLLCVLVLDVNRSGGVVAVSRCDLNLHVFDYHRGEQLCMFVAFLSVFCEVPIKSFAHFSSYRCVVCRSCSLRILFYFFFYVF